MKQISESTKLETRPCTILLSFVHSRSMAVSMYKMAAILITITLLLSGMPMIAGAVSANGEQVDILKALGIIDGTEMNLSSGIKRYEMAGFIVRLLGGEGIGAGTGMIVFNDVSPEDSYYEIVTDAYIMGLISGDENGNFNAMQIVKASEAVKMLVSALNYNSMAEQYGGYPNGYFEAARRIGILKGQSIAADAELTVEGAVRMLFSTLSTPDITVGISGDYLTLNIDEKVTFLRKRFEVSRNTGIVTGTSATKLIEGIKNFNDKIEIDGTTYRLKEGNEQELDYLLGQRVYYYLQNKDDDIRIIAVDAIESSNVILKINSDKIRKGNTVREFFYFDHKDNIKRINIAQKAIVFYNGQIAFNLEDSDFSPENGDVTFIDNDTNSEADYIIINDYKTYVVDIVSNNYITSKYDSWKLNLEDEEKYVLIQDDVEIANISIKEWDVLNVKEAKNGRFSVIELTGIEIGGIITEIFTEDDKTYVVINGEQYQVSESYLDASGETGLAVHFNAIPLKMGMNGNYIIDGLNKLVAVKNSGNSGKKYGYLVAINDRSKGFSDGTRLKIYEELGVMSIKKVSENVRINDKVRRSYDDVVQAFGGTVTSQFIMYELNSKGEVTKIETAVNLSSNPNGLSGYDKEHFSLDASTYWDKVSTSRPNWTTNKSAGIDQGSFEASNIRLANSAEWLRVSPTGRTPLFYIPADRNNDADYMFFWAYTNFYMFSTDTDIEIYDTVKYNEDEPFKKISAMVIYDRGIAKQPYSVEPRGNAANVVSNYRHSIIAERVNMAIDGQGNIVWKLTGIIFDPSQSYPETFTGYFADTVYNHEDNKERYGTKGKTIQDIKKGDLLWIAYKNPLSPNLEINQFRIVATSERYKDPNPDNYRIYSEGTQDTKLITPAVSSIVGEIVYAGVEDIVIRTKDNNGADAFYWCFKDLDNKSGYFVYNTATDRITQMLPENIQIGSQALIHTQYGGGIRTVIVVE